ncbi:hypothetical protein L6452_42654 [Arctium lappa]|uniref:Uncharacterized protein n=1 Tax=Arctium lappa TaxID=4217 RepID=A0ACB8XI86_ARCLA|nr:hypothetical protein L6452_42654 [Arctium lappa]
MTSANYMEHRKVLTINSLVRFGLCAWNECSEVQDGAVVSDSALEFPKGLLTVRAWSCYGYDCGLIVDRVKKDSAIKHGADAATGVDMDRCRSLVRSRRVLSLLHVGRLVLSPFQCLFGHFGSCRGVIDCDRRATALVGV